LVSEKAQLSVVSWKKSTCEEKTRRLV
jgi:hypothetical protein